eukprot:2140963-Amphidinium_carterae.1
MGTHRSGAADLTTIEPGERPCRRLHYQKACDGLKDCVHIYEGLPDPERIQRDSQLSCMKELDVMEPKTPEQIYKTHLEVEQHPLAQRQLSCSSSGVAGGKCLKLLHALEKRSNAVLDSAKQVPPSAMTKDGDGYTAPPP